MKSGKKVLLVVAAVGALLTLGCCVGGIVLFAMWNHDVQQEQAAWSAFGAACEGNAMPAAPALSESGSPRRVAVFSELNGVWTWDPVLIPEEWVAQSTASAPLVYCFEVEFQTIERCQYESGVLAGDNEIVREIQVQHHRVVSAHDGIVLAERVVEGPAPEPCPDEIEASRIDPVGEHRRLQGDLPKGDAARELLTPYVVGAAPGS